LLGNKNRIEEAKTMSQQATQPENSNLILLNMIACELNKSKTIEGFKTRLAGIRTLIEVSEKFS
jgi:hypothetical protein